MLPVDQSLGRAERLGRQKDFRKVFSEGHAVGGGFFRVLAVPNGKNINRIGIVAGRRLGKAVRRNKLKRRTREAYRKNKHLFGTGKDIVLIIKPEADDTEYGRLEADLCETIHSALDKCE